MVDDMYHHSGTQNGSPPKHYNMLYETQSMLE